MSAPNSSPPPYSLTPPEVRLINPAKRASSSPHLRLSSSSSSHLPSHLAPLSSHSRQAFSEYARSRRPVGPTSDDDETSGSGAETDDGVVFRRSSQGRGESLAETLRNRLLGKGKGRAIDEGWSRPITTTPGVPCAGETETEGEDSPRNLPTARITRSSLSQELALPPQTAWLVPIFFQMFRLLSIVPAVFGTLWNLYHVFRPPDGLVEWRVDYAVSMLWSILTGWQCLQLTTGLLKRWRVYYSPWATLIRLLALQAICWPATHLTLTILSHEDRPLICWAAIGTTTCCSRAIQLWVTSNIVPIPPSHPSHSSHSSHLPHSHTPPVQEEEEHMRKGRRRRWDWARVGIQCALPAGIVYAIMAWALVLRREFLGC
ncbi:N-glycosylation protein-domain-containing protein [Dichomitus squalens]|uniref:N-glycosylation protein-domain-containing protein n=1 Tax=Dichomitus squalens TaxID=114155 RepID=A0A4Q9PZH8_9APHY|nr:N-glycosylation protein-domain-containing protein [Dichomitus squalens]TBU60247.1 N-glycosylation protein-domain-containing protein [Dichomitus squalens]